MSQSQHDERAEVLYAPDEQPVRYMATLTAHQLAVIALALKDGASWYEKVGADNEWYVQRAKENRELAEYLTSGLPRSPKEQE